MYTMSSNIEKKSSEIQHACCIFLLHDSEHWVMDMLDLNLNSTSLVYNVDHFYTSTRSQMCDGYCKQGHCLMMIIIRNVLLHEISHPTVLNNTTERPFSHSASKTCPFVKYIFPWPVKHMGTTQWTRQIPTQSSEPHHVIEQECIHFVLPSVTTIVDTSYHETAHLSYPLHTRIHWETCTCHYHSFAHWQTHPSMLILWIPCHRHRAGDLLQ